MTDNTTQTELKADLENWAKEMHRSADAMDGHDEMSDAAKGTREVATLLERALAALSRPTPSADAVEALKNVLSAYTEYDQRLCCDGHECGCQASTLFEAITHYFTAALSTIDDSGDREEVEPVAWLYSPTEINPAHVLSEPFVRRHRPNMDPQYWTETPLYAHPPTPQDSGLADELEALNAAATPAPFYELGSPWHNGKPAILAESPDPHVARYIADFDFTGLVDEDDKLSEQPEADAALLIKLRNHVPEICSALRQPCNDGELLRIGDQVQIAPHHPDAELWNREKWFVVGMVQKVRFVDVWLAPECPPKSEGPTDGFHILKVSGEPDDIIRIDAALARLDQGEG